MHRFPVTPRKKARIEIIPMIDVMMFLLVFFVLISINVIPALGLKMKLPVSSQVAESHPPVRVVVGIAPQGPYQLDGQDVELAALGQTLLLRRQAATHGLTVVINGDESAPMQRLVDLMDTLKANGIESMTISARRK